MALLELRPDDCVHCFNRRRGVREQLEEQGADAAYITEYLRSVLCRGHTYEKEERDRREQRRQRPRR